MKDPVRPPLPNIILIGLMGCGKTTIGKELHRETNLRFTDTDQLIEQQAGMKHSADFQDSRRIPLP